MQRIPNTKKRNRKTKKKKQQIQENLQTDTDTTISVVTQKNQMKIFMTQGICSETS